MRNKKQTRKTQTKPHKKTRKLSLGEPMKKPKCSKSGLMGDQEDIFTLDVCSKYKGGGMPLLTPVPFVGSSYNFPNSLPGMKGDSSGNHYALNPYDKDVQLLIQNGGKRRFVKSKKGSNTRRKRRHHRGGGGSSLIPSSQVSYGFGKFYDNIFGYNQAVNPSPLVGQLPTTYFRPRLLY